MVRLTDSLKVMFFEGGRQISKDHDTDDDPSMLIDLNTIKGSNVLKIIMESNIIELKDIKYKIVERQFIFDKSELLIKMVKKRYLHL